MEWWQVAGLMVLAGVIVGSQTVLRARLATLERVPPAPAPPAPGDTHERCPHCAEVAVIRTEWAAVQKNLDAYFEALDDQAETIERARRRTAARKDPQPEVETDPRRAAIMKARAQGIAGI